jgi:hypothetical protein
MVVGGPTARTDPNNHHGRRLTKAAFQSALHLSFSVTSCL